MSNGKNEGEAKYLTPSARDYGAAPAGGRQGDVSNLAYPVSPGAEEGRNPAGSGLDLARSQAEAEQASEQFAAESPGASARKGPGP
jgi:hypothetical protein